MATPPVFTAGQVLTAAQMNAVGLWVVKPTTTFTAVSSIVADDVFPTDFSTFMVVFTYETSTTGSVSFQLSVGGVAATTNYNRQLLNAVSASVSASRVTASDNIGGMPATNGAFQATLVWTVNNPNQATATNSLMQREFSAGNFTDVQISFAYGTHSTATAYDGFLATAASGTTTGTYVVYGMRP
jgi:hypothetical protein